MCIVLGNRICEVEFFFLCGLYDVFVFEIIKVEYYCMIVRFFIEFFIFVVGEIFDFVWFYGLF